MGVKGRQNHVWTTEATRLALIEALIRVEAEERRKKSNGARPSAPGKGPTKWEQVANQLPRELRGRNSNDDFKCQRGFQSLLRSYCQLKRSGRQSSHKHAITKPVYEMMTKLCNARVAVLAEPSVNSRRIAAKGKTASTSSPSNTQMQLLLTSNSSLSLHSSKGQSGGREKEQAPTESSEEVPSRPVSDSTSLGNLAKRWTRAPSGAQARGRDLAFNAFRRPQSKRSRDSFPERRRTMLGSHASDDGRQQAIADGLRSKMASEVSSLSSWLQCESLPLAKETTHKMISCAIRSEKRRKTNVRHNSAEGTSTERFEDLIETGRSRMIDFRICSGFEKLRIRFAEELRSTVMQLAEEVRIYLAH